MKTEKGTRRVFYLLLTRGQTGRAEKWDDGGITPAALWIFIISRGIVKACVCAYSVIHVCPDRIGGRNRCDRASQVSHIYYLQMAGATSPE